MLKNARNSPLPLQNLAITVKKTLTKMKPKKTDHSQGKLFQSRISSLINPTHPLKILADKLEWTFFEKEFGKHYKQGGGQPPRPIRLMVGLLMLQHMFKKSDEKVVEKWVENPYWQYFCGYDYLEWQAPINPSSLTRFRQRLGENGMKKILQFTIQEGLKQGAIKPRELRKVTVDTTAMEKNITYPTNTKNLNKVRKQLVKIAKKYKIILRQNYEKLGKIAAWKAARYAHAKQFKRMRSSVKNLKNYLGRVVRDIERRIETKKELQEIFQSHLEIAKKLIQQTKKSKNKIYSPHAQEVYCIAKGKARKPYEFGCKVSLVTTQKKGFVLDATTFKENKHDSKTLHESLQNAEKNSGHQIKEILADKGYRGHGIKDKTILIPGQKRKLSRYKKNQLKQRSAIEARISHMKNQGKLDRNFLKGVQGDAINALLCAMGQNMRCLMVHNYLIIAFFRRFFALILCKKQLFSQNRKINFV